MRSRLNSASVLRVCVRDNEDDEDTFLQTHFTTLWNVLFVQLTLFTYAALLDTCFNISLAVTEAQRIIQKHKIVALTLR